MSRPGQNVVDVLKGSGSQCAPSVEVHMGVVDASHPTAMKPPCQRRTERTRLSGSSEASFRQRIPVHVAVSGGGTRVVNASGDGPAGVGAVVAGTAVPVPAGECGALDPTLPGGPGVVDIDATGFPHGLAMAIPMNATTSTTTSPAARRPLKSPVARRLSGVLWTCIVGQTSVGGRSFRFTLPA
jgi:hypothetical protein